MSSLQYPQFVLSMPWSREEDFKRNNVFSQYNLYGHAPAQEPTRPQGHEIYILVDNYLVIITMHLVCLNHAGVEKKIFERNN